MRYRPHDMRHTFISRLAENPTVSEQTIKALAGHVSRQMLERYSHIRSQAKQDAIQALDEQAIAPILDERRYNFRYSRRNDKQADEANSHKTNGGPARIRTLDQRIMSSSKGPESKEDPSPDPAKRGKVRQKMQPRRNQSPDEGCAR